MKDHQELFDENSIANKGLRNRYQSLLDRGHETTRSFSAAYRGPDSE